MKYLHELYYDVYEHYRNSQINTAFLSDTWQQTLKNRGNLYSFETMQNMLAPGNSVNRWVDDLNYLIDPTVIDPTDVVQSRILEIGESDFGSPRKDIYYNGKKFSSDFIHQTVHASKIIHALEERKIHEPAIMEIGGGLGGVAAILKGYYANNITLYCVDIPETLVCQECYLRVLFPHSKTSHKGTFEHVEFEKYGLNFINAYTVESQNFSFDVAINIDSMQEMDKEIVDVYLKFIERNISTGGLFYFQNQFGHSSSPVAEPSEYELDEYWTIRKAEIAYQIECAAETEQARFMYYRKEEQENIATRRFVLRLIWNGLLSGQISNSQKLIDELAALPGNHSPESALSEIEKILSRNGVNISIEHVSSLHENLFFLRDSFVSTFNTVPVQSKENKSYTQLHMEEVWSAQSELLKLMATVGQEPQEYTITEVKTIVGDICHKHFHELQDTTRSEYWTGYIACILFALGQIVPAKEMILKCASLSRNVYWLARFSYLLSRFQCFEESNIVLRYIRDAKDIDFYVLAKCVELEFVNGDSSSRLFSLKELEDSSNYDVSKVFSLAQVSAYVRDYSLALEVCKIIIQESPSLSAQNMLNIVKATSFNKMDSNTAEFIKTLIDICKLDEKSSDSVVAYGALLLAGNRRDEGVALIKGHLGSKPSDYYLLAKTGKILQDEHEDALADEYLASSITLRANAFMHYDFIGNVYLGAKRFDKACENYEKALEVKPYLRHIQSKKLYCQLPENIRGSAAIGKADNIPMIFQREQNFYNNLIWVDK